MLFYRLDGMIKGLSCRSSVIFSIIIHNSRELLSSRLIEPPRLTVGFLPMLLRMIRCLSKSFRSVGGPSLSFRSDQWGFIAGRQSTSQGIAVRLWVFLRQLPRSSGWRVLSSLWFHYWCWCLRLVPWWLGLPWWGCCTDRLCSWSFK